MSRTSKFTFRIQALDLIIFYFSIQIGISVKKAPKWADADFQLFFLI